MSEQTMYDMEMRHMPDIGGHFGRFGGKYAAETLMGPLAELEAAFHASWEDESFQAERLRLLQQYVGRPTPLYHAEH
ncbi:MAG: tryptophan synthase subunit beta, partial [Zetaproteobacteria bacterium CG_4_8_14_3_um_filter_59_5]